MTKPVRRFCSTQARLGMAIQTGRPLTAKRISVASAWRVAMATTVPFQVQCSSSPVQRSVTLKSSYMALSRVVQGEGLGKRRTCHGFGRMNVDVGQQLQRPTIELALGSQRWLRKAVALCAMPTSQNRDMGPPHPGLFPCQRIKRGLEFLFVIFVIVVIFVELRDLEDCTGFGEVEAVGGGFEGSDDLGGVGPGELGGVHAGELEAVEEGGGAFGVEIAGGQGVDDDGEGDLNGLAVFEGGELDVLAGDEIAAGSVGVAEAGVAAVEAGVEVAVEGSGERRGLALETVGLDGAAECVLHGFLLPCGV